MSKWPTVSLGDVAQFRYGRSLSASRRRSGPVPVYSSNGRVGSPDIPITSGETIIVGRKGSFGEVHRSTVPCWPIETTYYVDRDCTDTDLRWLFHLLQTLGLTELNRAAAVPGLNREDAYRKRLLLPPLPQQHRIAAILDQADMLREKRREAISTLSRLAQSVFIEMFGDPEVNPKCWPRTRLGCVASVQGGLQVSRARNSYPMLVHCLRVANVLRGALDLSEIKTIGVTVNELARTRLLTHDLLVVEGHGNPKEIGRVAKWDGSISDMTHQNHLIRVRLESPTKSNFVLHYLNSRRGRRHLLRSAKTTSGLNTISTRQVKETPLFIPPAPEWASFQKATDAIKLLRRHYLDAIGYLDELFASLQHRAFAGEL